MQALVKSIPTELVTEVYLEPWENSQQLSVVNYFFAKTSNFDACSSKSDNILHLTV